MFEGSLYGTPMQSLTLAIWDAYRTLDGPGFEPLISKASESNSFDGKESPEGIFRIGSLNGAELLVVHAGFPLVVGDMARYVRCSAGVPFQVAASGRRSGVGGG